jgi:hypothetical protein
MRRVYFRCNSGHYFEGGVCPWDGWSLPGAERLASEANRLLTAGVEVSIQSLADTGISHDVLDRTVVIDFGSSDSVFDALVPCIYLIGQKEVVMKEAHPHADLVVPASDYVPERLR